MRSIEAAGTEDHEGKLAWVCDLWSLLLF